MPLTMTRLVRAASLALVLGTALLAGTPVAAAPSAAARVLATGKGLLDEGGATATSTEACPATVGFGCKTRKHQLAKV